MEISRGAIAANSDSGPMSACGVRTPIRVGAQPSGCHVTISALRRWLHALEREQHVQVAGGLFSKGNERLVLRRIVPAVEGVHIWKFDDGNSLGLPMATLRHFVAAALCEVSPTVSGDHWTDLRDVFFEFFRISDDM